MVKRILNNNQPELPYRFKQRIIISIIFVIFIFAIILTRLSYLQIYQHDRYTTLSNKNQISIIPLNPKRGLIYDRNGVLLAENIPVYNLEVVADKIKDFATLIEKLGETIQISDNDITAFYKKLQQRQNWETIPIRQKLTDEEVARFAVNQYQFPGVDNNCTPPGDGVLSYSKGTNISLDETMLNENLGICGTTAWDWNGNSLLEASVVFDINSQVTCSGQSLSVLNDHNDWANLSFLGLFDSDGALPVEQEIITEDPVPDWAFESSGQPPEQSVR